MRPLSLQRQIVLGVGSSKEYRLTLPATTTGSVIDMTDAATLHLMTFDALKNRDLQAMRNLYHADYMYMAGDGREQPGAAAGLAVAETFLAAFPT
jgi:hypothetical protein